MYEEYLDGESVHDKNANYAFSVANIRRQLQAKAEREFNNDCILQSCPVGAKMFEMHKDEIYIHDLSKLILMPYCYSYSVLPLVTTGLNYNKNFPSKPAKRVTSFVTHLREFLSHVAVRTRGACAFPDLFVCLAHYVKKYDLLTNPEEIFSEGQTKRQFLENILQSFWYSVNQNLREGSESMFSNVSFFDRYYCESLFAKSYYTVLDITTEDIMQLQKFVLEWHTNEVLNVKMLRWPVITIALLKKDGEILDQDFFEFVCKQNITHTMYNFLVLENAASIASCCRLINQGDHPFMNSYGSGSVSIGSHQVVSLNLPYIYNKYGEAEFWPKLRELTDMIMEFLKWHRQLLKDTDYLDEMYAIGLRNIDRMFSTIGIIGFADLQWIAGWSWPTMEQFAKEFSELVASYKEFTNIELVPAESSAVELFDKDKCEFPDVPFYNETCMYSNQIVSNWDPMPLPEKMEITGRIAKYFSGGSMSFVCLQETFKTAKQMMQIINGIAQAEVPYFCFDTEICVCEDNHLTLSTNGICPSCGKPIIKRFRRTVGFFAPLEHMHERFARDLPKRIAY